MASVGLVDAVERAVCRANPTVGRHLSVENERAAAKAAILAVADWLEEAESGPADLRRHVGQAP